MTNTPNRLINENSPYLRQHAHNPVDWRPWDEEAFSRARAENKPIFLSIGYSACHWCHVMERESFEDPKTALFLNQHFISIKVDREERPDIDAIYMHAVQMLTGSGGWPMSVFLTPDRLPFYGGTYFPPEDRYGMPGFRRVLEALATAWEEHPDQVQTSARDITRVLQQALAQTPSAPAANNALPPAHLLTHAAQSALAAVDPRHGGFGNAPKFPPPGMLQLLIEAYRQTSRLSLLEPAALTLRQMARGGIFDQIGGGFHRYSVDAAWLVPHFEKMLYDNAQMAFVYMEAYQLTGEAAFKETATQTLNYLLRDMLRSDDLFCASEDADSEGEEGRYYLWTQKEIEAILPAEDAAAAIHGFSIAPEGNFPSPDPQHAGQNILHLAGTIPRDCLARIQPILLAQRATRPRPLRNETPITAWNALTIQALAFAGRVLDNPEYRRAALRAADALRKQIAPDGTLPHTLDERPERIAGFLDDYALTLLAMLDVYMLSFDPSWIETACSLAETMHQRFWDVEEGAYFSTESRHGQLPARAKTALDNVTPAGNSAAALALARLSILTHRTTYQDHALTIIHTFRALVEQTPLAAPTLLLAANALANTPWEIAIIGDPSLPAAQDLMKTAWRQAPPSSVIACGQPSEPTLPMLEGKMPVQRKPAAYCCRQSTCLPPTTDPAELDRLLRPAIPA